VTTAERLRRVGYLQGFAEGYLEGYARGFAEGRATVGRIPLEQALVEAILCVLTLRGLPDPTAARERLRECRDVATLNRLLQRAVDVATVEELLLDS
jgi:hypothetical protein